MMSSNSYKAQAPPDISTVRLDEEYDYKAAAAAAVESTPSVAAAEGWKEMQQSYQTSGAKQSQQQQQETSPSELKVSGEEALLDLAQLEELQHEAERMKALGNKHMASQEYSRAYNAYSAALQLAPVGPSSHVFLSNRAAALLSLKRYQAAATDARRAIALAPTFGKAHARLGQALYFLKDYTAAIAAYQDALEYEPDNTVTRTYLEKAQHKLEKHERRIRGEEVSVAEETQMTPSANSVVTDTGGSGQRSSNAILRSAYRQNTALSAAVQSGTPVTTPTATTEPVRTATTPTTEPVASVEDEEDPDFDQALQLQQRANAYLTRKKYKEAIEEYTAALFLVPDDENLSPDLHLGRAHALNGSRRHESARNDARLAIQLHPSPAAYSTLAKSYFYMHEYSLAIQAFVDCTSLLPSGEKLGMFDQAYLEKAQAALAEQDANPSTRSVSSASTPVPKLPPPRFVPREEAIQSTPNLPRMPKNWPSQQSVTLQCGAERTVVFLSESLGVQLNRGPDGVVRVLRARPAAAGSPVARQGDLRNGDVVREVAGVDLRRPITNIMWGDTVALVKMAPRPIAFVVAEELSPVPAAVLEEQRKVAASPSSGDEAVGVSRDNEAVGEGETELADENIAKVDGEDTAASLAGATTGGASNAENPLEDGSTTPPPFEEPPAEDSTILPETSESSPKHVCQEEQAAASEEVPPIRNVPSLLDDASSDEGDPAVLDNTDAAQRESLRQEEERMVGGELLFLRDQPPAYCGWDSLRWMSYTGIRRVRYCQRVYRLVESEKKQLFWTTNREEYVERVLLIYDEPNLCLLVRRPSNLEEVKTLLGLPDVAEIEDSKSALESYWVVESAVEPTSAKLRLSSITTMTSPAPSSGGDRAKSCFALMTPVESILLSVVRVRDDVKKEERSFSDSGAFLETSAAETIISKVLCAAHEQHAQIGHVNEGITWKHQLVLGTLHAFVVSGNQTALEEAIALAAKRVNEQEGNNLGGGPLPTNVIDMLDDNGLTALYYACSLRMSAAVQTLVKAGANVNLVAEEDQSTLVHICARNLDDKSLSTILSATLPKRPNPNAITSFGRSPMFVAAVEGRSNSGLTDASALGRCLTALKAWGGEIGSLEVIKTLAEEWRYQDLAVVLEHSTFRYPLPTESSLSAFYLYPLHLALLTLRSWRCSAPAPQTDLLQTINVLLNHGFEPNERLDRPVSEQDDFPLEYIGYTPLQILADVASELEKSKELLDPNIVAEKSKAIADLAEALVGMGGRIGVDAPSFNRLRRNESTSSIGSASESGNDSASNVSQSKELAFSSKTAFALLGGEERLRAAAKIWTAKKTVHATDFASILPDAKCVFADSGGPGGSDEKSCAVCWKSFGSIMNRRHKCRISRRYVCDDCSTKRIEDESGEHRITDGQFLLALVDAKRQENQEKLDEIEKAQSGSSNRGDTVNTSKENSTSSVAEPAKQASTPTVKTPRSVQAAREDRMKAQEQSNRDSLFGGLMDQASSFVFGEDDESEKASEKATSMTNSLNETRNALLDRGKKLESLGEKSNEMVNASADFARMAKELRKKSEGGFFW